MKQTNYYINDMLDMDDPSASRDIIFKAFSPTGAYSNEGKIVLEVPVKSNDKATLKNIIIRAYGDSIVRLTANFGDKAYDDADSLMLQWDNSIKQDTLCINDSGDILEAVDLNGKTRVKIYGTGKEEDSFAVTVLPDGKAEVPFNIYDSFTTTNADSISLGFVERDGAVIKAFYSLQALPDERFAGTGERFRNMDLSGQTIILENDDALGVNSRRAYKNIPFYISSNMYGLFIHTPAHAKLSFSDISTRAAQGVIEDDYLDLFFIGGSSIERILYNYRCITGFPFNVPLWSYGIWMSKLSYYSAEEVRNLANRLRDEDFPCDVIHIDTGWFKKPWNCDWSFCEERFPNPTAFINDLRNQGYRLSLWQLPFVSVDTDIFEYASKNNYIVSNNCMTLDNGEEKNDLFDYVIDFTNPDALDWYKGMLKELYEQGVSVIKTDFGENIKMKGKYHGASARLLHNIYSLIYQNAAFEVARDMTDEPIIWARAGWAGCQRHPVHWGGDSVCTWDGMAGTVKGGLHIGLSGFAFWSHDVPGFYGRSSFEGRPDDELYVRWSQLGVFTSHMRYHGTSDREPYNYPGVADIVRKWFKLRYALIPYFYEQGKKAASTGYPIFRALIFHNEKDPVCWNISDQFYCGDNLLVAPVMNPEGIRNVYLPKGQWVDIWTGNVIEGPVYLLDIKSDLEHIPVYAITGSSISIYPKDTQCTDAMDFKFAEKLTFDNSFKGIKNSVLGELTGL